MNEGLIYEPLYPDTVMPTRATPGAAGYDLHAYLKDRAITCYSPTNIKFIVPADRDGAPTLCLMPYERAMVPVGFKAAVPVGFEAQVRPRSGKSLKVGMAVLNSPGTIDEDFRGEWMVLIENRSAVPLVIDHGEPIAQAKFSRYWELDFHIGAVDSTERGAGGFGSTR